MPVNVSKRYSKTPLRDPPPVPPASPLPPPAAEFLKSRAESLKVLLNADTHKARMQILALTAARVEVG